MKNLLFIIAVIIGALYVFYRFSSYDGDTGGKIKYATTCSFKDWLFRRCQVGDNPHGGILVR